MQVLQYVTNEDTLRSYKSSSMDNSSKEDKEGQGSGAFGD